jgi:hypothetical protein
MRICGVELKTSEAVLCIVALDRGTFNVPECRQRLFTVSQSTTRENMLEFQRAFAKLMEDYGVDEIVIIERAQKGKFAGSSSSFKLETAIQLLDIPSSLITPQVIKEQLKRNPLAIDFSSLGLKKFQQPAFDAAFALHNQRMYAEDEL